MGVYSGNDVDNTGAAEVNLQTSAGTELLGQQTSAGSVPVVVASDQSTLPVTDSALTNGNQKSQVINSSGVSVDARAINTTPVNGDIGLITNSIIYGHTTAGGGSYVEVKVNPSGALTADVTGSTVTANAGTNLNTSALLLDATFTGRINTLGQKTSANSTPIVIASDQSIIPVVENATPKAFSATMSKTAIGLTELNTIFLKNPNGSGKTLIIKQITVTNTHTVTGSLIRWRVYSNPTTSANGSAITVGVMNVGSGNTASATPFNTPTSSATGQLLDVFAVLAGATTLGIFNRQFTVAANNTILITAVADATSRVGDVTIIWEEE